MESLPAESLGDSDATEDVVDMAMRAVQERSQRILEGDESVGSIGGGRRGVADDEDDDEDEDEIFIPAMVRDVARMEVQPKAEEGTSTAGAGASASAATATPAIPSRAQSQSPTSSRTAQDIFLQMLNGQTSFGGGRWGGGSPSLKTVPTPTTGSATSSSLFGAGAPAASGAFGEIGSGRPSIGSGSGSGTPVSRSSPGIHQRNTFQALPHPSLGGSSIWGGGGVWGSSNAGGPAPSDPWTVGAYGNASGGFGGGWNGTPLQQRDGLPGFEQSQQQQQQQPQHDAAYLRRDPWAPTPR